VKPQASKWDFLITLTCVIGSYLGNAVMANNLDISELLDTGAGAAFAITGVSILSYLKQRFGNEI